MGATAAAAALAGADDRDDALLIEAQQLAEAQLEPARDAAGDLERRAGLAAFDLTEHGRAHTAALREVAQAEVHGLAQRAHARADVDGRFHAVDGRHTPVRYHVQLYPLVA